MTANIQAGANQPRASEAAQAVEALRSAINEFHRARHQTRRYLTGEQTATDPRTRQPISASELARRVASLRDGQREAQAASELIAFQRLALQREPTPEDAQVVLPPSNELGLGAFPIVGLAALIGGAFALTSLFTYLAEHERRLQQSLGIETGGFGEKLARTAAWLLPAALVIGAGVGGWYLWRRREPKENPEPEPEQEPEGEKDNDDDTSE